MRLVLVFGLLVFVMAFVTGMVFNIIRSFIKK